MNSDWPPADPVPHDLTAEQCFGAVRTVAGHATDAAELTTLLDMLGLTAEQGRTEPEPPATDDRPAPSHAADLQRLANPFLPIRNDSRVHRRRPRVTALS